MYLASMWLVGHGYIGGWLVVGGVMYDMMMHLSSASHPTCVCVLCDVWIHGTRYTHAGGCILLWPYDQVIYHTTAVPAVG